MITLHNEEKIVFAVRRHWVVMLGKMVIFFLAVCAPFIIIVLVNFLSPAILEMGFTYPIISAFVYLLWFFVVWLFFCIQWTNYYLDVLVVTSERVIDIEQLGLFARDVAEVRIHNIEDMRVEIVGFVPTILGYGNLHIQSAGASREFVIKNIADPMNVKDVINSQHTA